MATVTATIESISPLLMHRFGEAAEMATGAGASGVRIIAPADEEDTPRSRAEQAVYRNTNGTLYFPAAGIARLLREAGANHKQSKSRKTLKWLVPSAIIVLDDTLSLMGPDGGALTDYEVDARPVVIPATKGRIMRYRPRIEKWNATVTMEIITSIIDLKTAHLLLEEGGRQLGIGDFRPEKGGPFGRFAVVRWNVTD
jgi:hypothetical protein